MNGPYSAKALEQRNVGEPPHPGSDNLKVATLYFLKAAKLNFAQGRWQGWMLALAVFGTVTVFLSAVRSHALRRGSLLLLWFPLPFYAFAIAYGDVPIFVPGWYPFSNYNVRYGLELLPAFAVFAALAVALLLPPQQAQIRRLLGTPELHWPGGARVSRVAAGLLVLVLVADYVRIAGATPICLREARANSAARLHLESQLADALRRLPPRSTLLMYTAEHVGVLQNADVPLRRVVSEASEATGIIWNAALSCPAQVADYVVAFDGDPVAQAVKRNPRWLEQVSALRIPGNPEAAIYRSRFPGRH